jgi:hypothetical protein
MYRKWWFLSNSKLVRPYCDTLWKNRESAENINLGHNVIKREPKAHQSIEQKDSFENHIFQWFMAPQNMTETDQATTQIVSRLLIALCCVNIIGGNCIL